MSESDRKGDAKLDAYILIDNVIYEIRKLPRFSGQTQLLAALKRVHNLSLWNK